MSDLDRLIDGFDAGELVRPFAGSMSLVDVVRASATVLGVEGMLMSDASRAFADQLMPAEHIIFVIADGLGVQFIERLPRGSWLRKHMQGTIQPTFPATTSVSLTTIATGDYPSEHGVTGWWTHLPSIATPVTVFHNVRSLDDTPLDKLDIGIRELYPSESLMRRMPCDVALMMPPNIVDSKFSRYMAGGRPCIAYGRHAEAAQTIAERITCAGGPTYTYWYTPYPDTLAHQFGTHDERVMASIEDLDDAIGVLVAALRTQDIVARIIVTADHGHLDIGGAGNLEIAVEDPLLAFLVSPPAGDVRTLFWHVRPGMHEAFATAFAARFGEWFLLLTTADVEETCLLGPDPLSDVTRSRIGDFTSVALGREVLRYAGAPGHDRYLTQRSHHSGLSPEEMSVPLILIRTEDGAQPDLDFTRRS